MDRFFNFIVEKLLKAKNGLLPLQEFTLYRPLGVTGAFCVSIRVTEV